MLILISYNLFTKKYTQLLQQCSLSLLYNYIIITQIEIGIKGMVNTPPQWSIFVSAEVQLLPHPKHVNIRRTPDVKLRFVSFNRFAGFNRFVGFNFGQIQLFRSSLSWCGQIHSVISNQSHDYSSIIIDCMVNFEKILKISYYKKKSLTRNF